jgi:hypothetical protein
MILAQGGCGTGSHLPTPLHENHSRVSTHALKNPIKLTERSEYRFYIFGERARGRALRHKTSGGTIPGLSSELKNLDKE